MKLSKYPDNPDFPDILSVDLDYPNIRIVMPTSIEHTIDIFTRLFNQVESVLPAKFREEMNGAVESLKNNLSLTLEEVEDTVILFGKKVWPYRKALNDFISNYEAHHGEKILLAKLSRELRKRFLQFKETGGSLRDLHIGTNLDFFTPEERLLLCAVLIEMKAEIRSSVTQAVKSTEKQTFEEKVDEYKEILRMIEQEIEHLEQMADEEQEHPHLAGEIRANIRGFEYGLSLLGPEVNVEAICNAREHFNGRKYELTKMP